MSATDVVPSISSSHSGCAHVSPYLTRSLLLRGGGQPSWVRGQPPTPKATTTLRFPGVPWPSLLPQGLSIRASHVRTTADRILSFSHPKPSCSVSRALPRTLRTPQSGPATLFNVISSLLSLWSQHCSPTHPLTGPSSAPSSMGGCPPPPRRGCRAREYTRSKQTEMCWTCEYSPGFRVSG